MLLIDTLQEIEMRTFVYSLIQKHVLKPKGSLAKFLAFYLDNIVFCFDGSTVLLI